VITITEDVLIDLIINEEKINAQLNSIKEKTEKLDEIIENTNKKSSETWMLAVGVAQSSWSLLESVLSSVGIAIPGMLRATVQGAFAAINIMRPLIAAEAVTPGMQIAAGIGFANILLAIAAASTAQTAAGEIEQQMKNATGNVLADVNSLIGEFNF